MKDEQRIEPFLEALSKVWKKMPDMTFGQLIADLGLTEHQLFHIADEEIIKLIQEKYT